MNRGGSRGEGRSKVQGNMGGDTDDDSSDGDDDASGSRGDGSDEDLSVNSAAKRKVSANKGSRGVTRVGSGVTNGRVAGARGSARGGGSDLDSDEFMDDDDDDDDDDGVDGDDSAGSDEAF
jgi:hypothetical protein